MVVVLDIEFNAANREQETQQTPREDDENEYLVAKYCFLNFPDSKTLCSQWCTAW